MAKQGANQALRKTASDVDLSTQPNASPGRKTLVAQRYGTNAAQPQIQWLDNPFQITHYTIALEDDPKYANDPLVQAPGLREKHREGFLFSDTGVLMQGSGQTSTGEYITIDWSAGGPRGRKTHFTYGLGGASGKPEAWKTVASDPSVVPQGSRVVIETYEDRGEFLANDTGGAIKGNHLDVFVGGVSIADAFALGTKSSRVGLVTGATVTGTQDQQADAPAPAEQPESASQRPDEAPTSAEEFPANTRGGFTARALVALGRDDKVEDVLLDARYRDVASRAEIAAIAAKLLGVAPTGSTTLLSDVDGSHWAAGAITACFENGIMLGIGGNQFLPDQDIQVADAQRALELLAQGSQSTPGTESSGVESDTAGPILVPDSDIATTPPAGSEQDNASVSSEEKRRMAEVFALMISGQLEAARAGAQAAAAEIRAANGLTFQDRHPSTDAYGLIWQVASNLSKAQASMESRSYSEAIGAAKVAEERSIELQVAGWVPADDAEKIIAAARGWQERAAMNQAEESQSDTAPDIADDGTVSLDVPYYHQLKNQYKPYGTCNITTVAMAVSYRTGKKVTPDQIYRKYGRVFDGPSMARIAKAYGCSNSRYHAGANAQRIKSYIDQGVPVILQGYFTNRTFGHIILIVGYDESGWIVNDPYGEWFSSGYRTQNSGDHLHYSENLIDNNSLGGRGKYHITAIY